MPRHSSSTHATFSAATKRIGNGSRSRCMNTTNTMLALSKATPSAIVVDIEPRCRPSTAKLSPVSTSKLNQA
jgi:hypothetical protein